MRSMPKNLDIHCPECLNIVYPATLEGDGESWIEYGCANCELSWNDEGKLI